MIPLKLQQLFVRNYKALNVIEVSKKNLIFNYRYLSKSDLKVAPVLKSNAYGHGLLLVAKALDPLNAPFFCVDSLYEAYQLLDAGIKTPVLIMGYIDPLSLKTKKLPFSFAVYTKGQIKALQKYQPTCKVHLFIDTGMNREGFLPDELSDVVDLVKKTNFEIEGVMSHFAQSEAPNRTETKLQLKRFEEAILYLKAQNITPKFIHIANSSGILNSEHFSGSTNTARSGIGLYGIDPEGKNSKLKPVLSLYTHIAQIKTIEKGAYVGYSFTYKVDKKTRLAILPIGYSDGVNRRLSDTGFVKVGSKVCPLVGRVSMNISTIDISTLKSVKEGDLVQIFSEKTDDLNSIQKASKIAKIIPYELLVGLNPSIKRVLRG